MVPSGTQIGVNPEEDARRFYISEKGVVLVTHGDIVCVDVSEASLRVAASALIGWTGALTPRLTTLAEGASGGDARAVELTGEGRGLLDSCTAGG